MPSIRLNTSNNRELTSPLGYAYIINVSNDILARTGKVHHNWGEEKVSLLEESSPSEPS